MEIFEKKKSEHKEIRSMLISVVICVLLIIFLFQGLNNVSSSSQNERLQVAEQAVRRSVVQCYALEGRYPANLEYLADNYGLILDYDSFVYHYAPIAGNLMPQISVFTKDKVAITNQK